MIFISYRRADSESVVGRIYSELKKHFPTQDVFLDHDSIPLGKPFLDVIRERIVRTKYFLVLIGPDWLSRLEDPNDFVRLEVETALATPDVTVIPVLVNRAQMPPSGELPESLQPLLNRHGISVRPDNGVVTCWDTSNLQMRWKLTDPLPRLFQSAAFSMHDEWIFLGTTSGDIVVVDTATGQILAEQNAVIGTSITSLVCSLDGTLAIGASDGQIRLIAVDSLINGVQLKGHRGHINEIAIVPRSGLLLTASQDRTAMLWDIADLANPIVLQGHREEVRCVAVSKEQDIAATGGYDGVILWQLPNGLMIGKRSVPGAASSLAFSPNRTWLGAATGGRDACVWLLEGDEVYPFRTFHTDVDSIHEVVFDPSGDFLFALHSRFVIDGWRIRDGKQVLKDRLPRTETNGWKQAQRPRYEWDSKFRLWKDHLDLAVWHEAGIISWWPGRGYRIEAVTPNRFAIWQGGSALEFVEIREFNGEEH